MEIINNIQENFRKNDSNVWLIIAFLFSFNSINYQLLISSKLSYIEGEAIYIYPLSLGVFIFFMGIGSFITMVINLNSKSIISLLILIEMFLVIIGGISIITIDYFFWVDPESIDPTNLGLVYNSLIGLLTGFELPLLLLMFERHNYPMSVSRNLILYDYVASFVASLAFIYFFTPVFGHAKSALIIASLNLAIFLYLVPIFMKNKILKAMSCLAISALVLLSVLPSFSKLELNIREIGASYIWKKNMKIVEKENTKYQEITLFVGRQDGLPVTESVKEIAKNPSGYVLTAALDGAFQFYANLGAKTDDYHKFLVKPAMRILSPKSVLVMGGGDGLAAKELLKWPTIKRIDMVDLDEEWIAFTQKNSLMKIHSHNSLNSSKVNIEYDDAFKWIIKNKQLYDLIIVDFPAFYNLAAIRQGTIQWAADIKRRLNPGGVVIHQEDAVYSSEEINDFFATVEYVGGHLLYAILFDESMDRSFSQSFGFRTKEEKVYFMNEYYKLAQVNKWDIKFIKSKSSGNAKPLSFYDPHIFQKDLESLMEGFLYED